jgi:hypothetical protein
MNIAKILGLKDDLNVILIGSFEPTSIVDSEGQPYYLAKLKNPVLVSCSTDKLILPHETDEVLVRKSAVFSEDWVLVNGKDEKDGFYMEVTLPDGKKRPWIVDFSKGQAADLYQPETIKAWSRGIRSNGIEVDREKINTSLRAKIEAKGKK